MLKLQCCGSHCSAEVLAGLLWVTVCLPSPEAFQLPPCQLINQTVSLEKEGCPKCHPVETTICSGHCITKVSWWLGLFSLFIRLRLKGIHSVKLQSIGALTRLFFFFKCHGENKCFLCGMEWKKIYFKRIFFFPNKNKEHFNNDFFSLSLCVCGTQSKKYNLTRIFFFLMWNRVEKK